CHHSRTKKIASRNAGVFLALRMSSCCESSLSLRISRGARRLGRIAFFAMAFHFAKRVNRLGLRLVIGLLRDFAEQTHGNELNPANEQRHGEQHQRSVLRDEPCVTIDLLEREIGADQHAKRSAADSNQSKELRRTSRIIEQKLHDHEVE